MISALMMAAALAAAAVPDANLSSASNFPGDVGKPFKGIPPAERPPPRPPRPVAPGPAMNQAQEAAKAAVAACSGYHVGVAIVDASGTPKLIYIPDGTAGYHAYMALRKALSALAFKEPTSLVGAKAKADAAFAAKIVADPNLMAYAGGLPIIEKGEVIGAIGVSGAEPSATDERCAVEGLQKASGTRP